jgi:hypothetical protein
MLLFSYVLPDFSYEIVKSINMKLARLKIGMDITRGYIEDPRLEGYEYNNNDATKPGLLAIPPFNYERFMLDLTKNDIFDEEEEDNLEFQLAKKQSLIDSLYLRINQDQEFLNSNNNNNYEEEDLQENTEKNYELKKSSEHYQTEDDKIGFDSFRKK